MTSRRRFIAGAVCPGCGLTDRTVLEVTQTERVRTCIACGHRETLAETGAPMPEGRFGQRPAARQDVAPVAVRLLDTPRSGRHAGEPPKGEE